ncbi:MAG: hypothetical protein R6V36_06600 [Psychroflexus sp.]
MKKLLIILLVLPLMVLSQEADEQLLTLTEFTVKQGHAAPFLDGIKKVKECYTENGGTDTWNFWSRVQGEGNVYAVSSFMSNWSEMDKKDKAWDSCRMIMMNFIMPHVEKSNYAITQTLSDWSKKGSNDDMKLVWVTYFKVQNTSIFSEVVKDVSSTIAKEEGDNRGYWYSFMGGGESDPDYMVSEAYPSYAALDQDYVSPFKVYEKVHGEKKTKEMRDKWRNAIDGAWSYIWKLDEDLSN